MFKRILIQCATLVARNAVKRMVIDGVEHVVIRSMTLPDDIVMNGGLYPADEIEKSYKSLERTLAPVEHPTDSAGSFISATDPTAIHNFYAGAFNQNVRRENGRVAVDKVINVAEALKTDRGKRLLDRVTELETNENARPIHTSVGVFVEVEELSAPQANAKGEKFTWVARNMVFDHDAILLDSVGAAQPHQGVGMAVNDSGERIDVHRHVLGAPAVSVAGMSVDEVRTALCDALRADPVGSLAEWLYVDELYDDYAIVSADGNLFKVSYTVDATSKRAALVSLLLPVRREITYVPKTNNNQPQGDAMRELMLKALADAGVTVNADMSDAELMAKYNELQAFKVKPDGGVPADGGAIAANAVAAAVNAALEPVLNTLKGVEAKINQRETEELTKLAEIIGNSEKYPGIDVETAKNLPVETLRKMAANCQPSYGIPLNVNADGTRGDDHKYEMPN